MTALLLSVFLTIVVFSLWAVNLNRKLSLSSGESEAPASAQAASPFSSLKEAFGRASDGIGEALGNFRALGPEDF